MRTAVLLGSIALTAVGHAVAPRLSTVDPFSGTYTKVSLYTPGVVTLVVESDCTPCIALLDELKATAGLRYKFDVVWANQDERQCILLAQKFKGLGRHFCGGPSVKDQWGVKATPTLFWKTGGVEKRAQGRPTAQEIDFWFR